MSSTTSSRASTSRSSPRPATSSADGRFSRTARIRTATPSPPAATGPIWSVRCFLRKQSRRLVRRRPVTSCSAASGCARSRPKMWSRSRVTTSCTMVPRMTFALSWTARRSPRVQTTRLPTRRKTAPTSAASLPPSSAWASTTPLITV